MTDEELRSIKRSKHLKEKMANNRAHIFRETGMISGDESFYMCLFRNKIEELPENYSYLLPVDDLIQRIEKDSAGFYYLEDTAILEYRLHSDFHIIKDRVLKVITQRNLEIDSSWHDSAHVAKYRFDYWSE